MSNRKLLMRVQQALAAKGFNPGLIDGVWGRRTEAAVRAFQASRGLVADGIVGPKTLAVLLPEMPLAGAEEIGLPWYQTARRLLGTREKPGSGSNPDILDWAKDAGIDYPSDDIPWCGLFVAHCIASSLPNEPLVTNPLLARAWLRFGGPIEPQLGAILVFWRGSKDSFKGHVGFYAGEDKADGGAYLVLGGNQSDSVSLARIAKDRLLDARWPVSVPFGAGITREVATAEARMALSVDEA